MLIPLSSFQGVTTGGVMKCYLKEVDNDGMLRNDIDLLNIVVIVQLHPLYT